MNMTNMCFYRENIILKINQQSYEIYLKLNNFMNEHIFYKDNILIKKKCNNVVFEKYQKKEINNEINNKSEYIDNLYKEIKRNAKRVMYYTGAGISRCSGIITLIELEEQLLLNNIDLLNRKLLIDPDYLLNVYNNFLNSIKIAKPNYNHYILKKIINEYGGILLTENMDVLHEKSGIMPIKVFKDNIDNIKYYIAKSKVKILVILGASNLQCIEILDYSIKHHFEINLVSFNPLNNKGLIYNYYSYDITTFLINLYKKLGEDNE